MSELSEEEIIKILKHVIEPADIEHMSFYEIYENYVPLPKLNEAIQGLLDLYQKEKEKNEKLEDKIKARIEQLQAMYNKLPVNPKDHLHSKTEYKIVIGELQELLKERN